MKQMHANMKNEAINVGYGQMRLWPFLFDIKLKH